MVFCWCAVSKCSWLRPDKHETPKILISFASSLTRSLHRPCQMSEMSLCILLLENLIHNICRQTNRFAMSDYRHRDRDGERERERALKKWRHRIVHATFPNRANEKQCVKWSIQFMVKIDNSFDCCSSIRFELSWVWHNGTDSNLSRFINKQLD